MLIVGLRRQSRESVAGGSDSNNKWWTETRVDPDRTAMRQRRVPPGCHAMRNGTLETATFPDATAGLHFTSVFYKHHLRFLDRAVLTNRQHVEGLINNTSLDRAIDYMMSLVPGQFTCGRLPSRYFCTLLFDSKKITWRVLKHLYCVDS